MVETKWTQAQRRRIINEMVPNGWSILGMNLNLGKVVPDLVFGDSKNPSRVQRIQVVEIVDTHLSSFWGQEGTAQREEAEKEIKSLLKIEFPALQILEPLWVVEKPRSGHWRISYENINEFIDVPKMVWTEKGKLGRSLMKKVQPGDIIWCYVNKIGIIQKRRIIDPGFFFFHKDGLDHPAIQTQVIADLQHNPITVKTIIGLEISPRGTFGRLKIPKAHALNRELEKRVTEVLVQ